MDARPSVSVPALLAFCALAPVIWFVPDNLTSWGAAASLSGWAGCGLLLGSLLLMVREVRLSHWLGGVAHMTLWHHRAGLAAYLLLLLHPLLLAADGWQQAPALGWLAITPVPDNPAIRVGWVSLLLLMTGLSATFIYRLPYRLWRGLHSALGVAVVLGGVHVLLLKNNPFALLVIALAGGLFLWRLVRIDAGSAAQAYYVKSVLPVATDLVEIMLTPSSTPVIPPVQAGQLVFVAFAWGSAAEGSHEAHPFTVSGVGQAGEFCISVKALGDATRALQDLVPGVRATVQGGFDGFLADQATTPQLWVAGGIGITPFLAALRTQTLTVPTHLLYLYPNAHDAAYLDELRARATCQPLLTLDLRATGNELPDINALLPPARALQGVTSYLCGPPGLMQTVLHALQEKGIPLHHIHSERFDFR